MIVGLHLPMTMTTKSFIPTWQGVLDTTTFSVCDRICQTNSRSGIFKFPSAIKLLTLNYFIYRFNNFNYILSCTKLEIEYFFFLQI